MGVGGPASWRLKRQTDVARSRKELEYVALTLCLYETMRLGKFEIALRLVLPKEDVDAFLQSSIAVDNHA